jgi:ketohexokinase
MANILAIGIATIDIINQVEHYPAEDEELRTLSQQQVRGGNATNTLVVLSQFGHTCDWTGILVDEPDAEIIKHDLDQAKVSYQHCLHLATGKMPTSYIAVSAKTGSRTIIHHRDCPELPYSHFKTLDLSHYDWLHFEGRNIEELTAMLRWVKQQYPTLPCSLEIEKPRDNIESLFDFADVLMFSQPYAQSKGHETASSLLNSINTEAIATCTWGTSGAWLKSQGTLYHSPAFPPEQVVDTLGAGDTFNAALINALVSQQPVNVALDAACHLAGHKCGQTGFSHLVTSP